MLFLLLLLLPALTNVTLAQRASAADRDVTIPDAPKNERVKLNAKSWPARPTAKRSPATNFDPSGHTTLPGAGSATVPVGLRKRAGATPVSVTAPRQGAAPAQVRVTATDAKTAKAAGVHGMLFSVRGSGSSGTVGIDVDSSTFRNAYGGDFGSRLHLVRMPACALTTPSKSGCRTQTPIASSLSAQVTVAATEDTVLAATSSPDGPTGDYKATSLSPGGSWAVGGNNGAFTYSYPIVVPPGVGALSPAVVLNYNSASQDARTEGTNNQSSWLGDGWSSSENYVERTYKSCDDVTGSGAPEHDGDSCWAGQILTLSLNGSSTAIVYDDTTHTFRPAGDGGAIKIERLDDATNGTKNGEYFKVTENGTQYFFGLNHLPGWAAGKEETKSAWTMPVYKAHAGVADCPDGSFADTACTLGWRFNLDYVVDPHGNAIAYYFAPENGYYGANMKDTAVSYVRGGSIERIDYGLTASTVYSPAPEQVFFHTEERCLANEPAGNTCSDNDFGIDHPAYWPDTPVDLNCAAGATDCTNHGPSFWSRRRLTSINTQVLVDGTPNPVDRWDFVQKFPDGGDHAPTMWLESIRHTGLDRLAGADSDVATAPVTFYPTPIANRVGTLPGLPRMFHQRIDKVVTETGAETDVTYKTPDCSSVPDSTVSTAAAQAFASTNTTGCFPVFWAPEGQPEPLLDWFYTHPVTKVVTFDNSNHFQDGSQPKLVTEYDYEGDPGWHYDDNEVVKAKNRTYGQFRGYPEVDITTGDTTVHHRTDGTDVFDRKTLTKSFYFLGMNGDTLPGGKTRSVPALTSQDKTVTVDDNDVLAGQLFETDTYTGDGGTLDSASVTVPTVIGPTASRARTGLPKLTAQMVRTSKTLSRTAVSYGWRKTETLNFYDPNTGLLVQTDDRGEAGAAGNVPHCTFTRYVTGTTVALVLPAETIVTDQDCTTANATPAGNVLADSRTSYDGNAFVRDGAVPAGAKLPTTGNVTTTEQATSAASTTTFVTVGTNTYDSYGRVSSTTRTPNSTGLAQTIWTRYSPASGATPKSVITNSQVTSGANCATVTTSSVNCRVSTNTLDPARQQPIAQNDIAGQLTSLDYDALGRLTAVWHPNRSKAAGAIPDVTHTYALSATGPTVVTSNTLLDNDKAGQPDKYATTETLYDALLRPLETQATGPNNSTTVTDTQYDSHGWTVLTNNSYSVSGAPAGKLISDNLSQVAIPQTTVTDHDAMGRATQETQEHRGVKSRITRTAYTGDKTTVLPPTGAVASTTVADARGQTTRLDQYTAAPTMSGSITQGFTATGGTSQSIAYGYTAAGKLAQVTGPDNAVWSFSYDLLGRQTSQNDPDTGPSSMTYNDAGNVTGTKDARGIELTFTYDLLGRKLTAVDKTKTNFKYASWTYDTLQIGKLTSSSRFVSGVTGAYTKAVTGYTALGNALGTKISLPTVEQPLPTSYTTTFAYTKNNELLAQQKDPQINGLPGETITYGHDPLGMPTSTSGIDLYVAGAVYTDFGQPSKLTRGPSTNFVDELFSYDEETLRLSGREVWRSNGTGLLTDAVTYTYDEAGNPLTAVDQQSETGNVVTDTQCYRYDGLARLTTAWTAKSNCADPSTATVSSATGSYWQSFTYDSVGDRTQLVDHSTTGAADVTTTYTQGCQASCNRTGTQPHTLTATTGGPDPTSFAYSVSGALLTRKPTKAPGQTLTWDDEGHLASVAVAGTSKPTQFVYDADGNQLIRRDPGKTTLFAGDTEITIDTSLTEPAALGAVRTYGLGGSTVAVRSTMPGGGASYLFNDPLGTSTLAVDTTTQAVSRKQYKPYGEDRSSANTTGWPDMTHGYLGKSREDQTGYTDLGARKYDPVLGRFISADPVLETTDPNQLGGYTYAADNPVAGSDPSGLTYGCQGDCIGSSNVDKTSRKTCAYTGKCPGGSVPFHNKGDGSGDIGGVTVGMADVTDLEGYAQRVKEAYSYLLSDPRGQWQNNSFEVKLLWAMFLGCEYAETVCQTPFRNATIDNYHDALFQENVCKGDAACFENWKTNTQRMSAALAFGFVMLAEVGLAKAADAAMSVFGVEAGAARAGTGGSSGCNSFAPGTSVLLADGSTKPIEQVAVGDEVLATDPVTGKTVAEKVTALHNNLDNDLTTVTVVSSDGTKSTVRTTANHPFWDASRNQWVAASRLRPGDRLVTATGAIVRVVNTTTRLGRRYMHNLTIADLHTYYVLAGSTPVLVHNSGCGPELSGMDNFGKKWGKHSKDYGLDPGDASARDWFRNRIGEVRNSHDEVRRGPWNPDNGGGTDYWFYRKDEDLLVTRGDGTFVTMFPGASGNGWFNGATRIPCGCK